MDTSHLPTYTQAVQNAQSALRDGDKHAARHWAELAAGLGPSEEEPWLLLAAVATPRASLAYLQTALNLNPNSQRAQHGLAWANKRLQEEPELNVTQKTRLPNPALTRPTRIQTPTAPPAKAVENTRPLGPQPTPAAEIQKEKTARQAAWLPLLLFSLACIALGALIFSNTANVSTALADVTGKKAGSAQWAEAVIAKPTYTQPASPTPLPSAFITATPWNLPAPLEPATTAAQPPEITPSPTASPAPLPTDTASPTPLPTDTALPTRIPPTADSSAQAGAQTYGGGKRIVVDLSQQHLYAYEGDNLVYSFVASTGMNHATRAGTFSVLDKIPNAYGSTWDLWMPDWMGIYYAGSLENGIHALPILSNGQRLWAGYLGTPISYGCVVLGINEAHLLYNWADIGTPVIIQY